jgi:glycosyltransferase involved in cell wall biosynthesis
MNESIIIWTHAYNAEKTLRRAVESILGQTYGNFTYYLLDNGSCDATGDIIREYAARDSRIVALYRKENLKGATSEYLPLFLSHGDNGYLAWLDADDEYKPDFLEKMLAFVLENHLDAAVCGTDTIEQDGSIKPDILPETLVFEGTGFASYFPSYYKYTTRLWAGFYSLHLLPMMDFPKPLKRKKRQAAFNDCMCALRAFHIASRAGVLSQSLHKFYRSPNQLSKTYTPKFFWWINAIHDQMRDFLLQYGPISKANEDFLWIRYLIWLKNILPRIQNADVPLSWKLRDLYNVFSDGRTKELLALNWQAVGIYTEKNAFVRDIRDWTLMQKLAPCHRMPAQKLIGILDACLEDAK